MATRSPTEHHSYWGQFALATDLPNVAGATVQSSTLEVGDQAYNLGDQSFYVCTDATLGAAVWAATGGGGGTPSNWKTGTRLASTAALPPYTAAIGPNTRLQLQAQFGGQLILDGNGVQLGDRVLIKDETGVDEPNNGIYLVLSAGFNQPPIAWLLERVADACEAPGTIVQGIGVNVAEGITNANTQWVLSPTLDPINVNVTPLSFVPIQDPLGPTIVFRPGVPSSGMFLATWAEVEAVITARSGDAILLIDSRVAPALVPFGTDLDGNNLLAIGPYLYGADPAGRRLTFLDGARLRNVRELVGPVELEGAPTLQSFLRWDPPANPPFIAPAIAIRDSACIRALAGSTLPPIDGSGWSLIPVAFWGATSPTAYEDQTGNQTPIVRLDPGAQGIVIIQNAAGSQIPNQFSPNLIGEVNPNTTSVVFAGDASAVRADVGWNASGLYPNGQITSLRTSNAANVLPSAGNTAGRPTDVVVGQMYFNTDLGTSGEAEWWDGTNWVNCCGNALLFTNWKTGVRAATTTALSAYTAAIGGFGRWTLTAQNNGFLVSDGVAAQLGNRWLVKDETGLNAPNNGIYQVVNPGSLFSPWELVRVLDACETPGTIVQGIGVNVAAGFQNANTQWVLSPTLDPINVNVTPLTFARVGPGGQIVVANVAALKNLRDSNLQNGQKVYVESLKTTWTRVVGPDAFLEDDITYVRSFSLTANWVRDTTPHAGWAYVYANNNSTIRVDTAIGDDEADGIVTPLKSLNEVSRRLPYTAELLGIDFITILVGNGGLQGYVAGAVFVYQTLDLSIYSELYGEDYYNGIPTSTDQVVVVQARDKVTVPQTTAQRQQITVNSPNFFNKTSLYKVNGQSGFAITGVNSAPLPSSACDSFFYSDAPCNIGDTVEEYVLPPCDSITYKNNYWYSDVGGLSLRAFNAYESEFGLTDVTVSFSLYVESCAVSGAGGIAVRDGVTSAQVAFWNTNYFYLSNCLWETDFPIRCEGGVLLDVGGICLNGPTALGSPGAINSGGQLHLQINGWIEMRDFSYIALTSTFGLESTCTWNLQTQNAVYAFGYNTWVGAVSLYNFRFPGPFASTDAIFILGSTGCRAYYTDPTCFTVTRINVNLPDWSYVSAPPAGGGVNVGFTTGKFVALGAGSSAPAYFTGIVQRY